MKTREEVEELKSDWLQDPEAIDLTSYPGFEEYHDELTAFVALQRARLNREQLERDTFASIIGTPDPSFDYDPVEEALKTILGDSNFTISFPDYDPDSNNRVVRWQGAYDDAARATIQRALDVLATFGNIVVFGHGDRSYSNGYFGVRPDDRKVAQYGIEFGAVITEEQATRGNNFRLALFSFADWLSLIELAAFEREVSKQRSDGWQLVQTMQSNASGVNVISVVLAKKVGTE